MATARGSWGWGTYGDDHDAREVWRFGLDAYAAFSPKVIRPWMRGTTIFYRAFYRDPWYGR